MTELMFGSETVDRRQARDASPATAAWRRRRGCREEALAMGQTSVSCFYVFFF